MKSRSLLAITFVLVIIFGFLHYLANAFYFYWTLWWFDYLMHFLGGLSLGLFSIWVGRRLGLLRMWQATSRQILLYVVAVVLVIGVGWEIFEYVNGLTQATESEYYMDVAHDLVSDTLGALVAYLWAGRGLRYGTMRNTNG